MPNLSGGTKLVSYLMQVYDTIFFTGLESWFWLKSEIPVNQTALSSFLNLIKSHYIYLRG